MLIESGIVERVIADLRQTFGSEPVPVKVVQVARVAISSYRRGLHAAGLVLEQGWQPIETVIEGDGAVKIGAASGVSFHMLYVLKARWEHAGIDAEEGWFAHAYGLLCFTGAGTPIQVFPTHWRHPPTLPAPPTDSTEAA